MRKKTELRRSCNLCRSRKIACSGEPICATCRERGVECVYDLEGLKGRPSFNQQTDTTKSESNAYPETWYSSLGSAPPNSSKKAGVEDEGKKSSSVAAELEAIYRDHFGEKPSHKRNNRFQGRVAEFNRCFLSQGRAIHSSLSSNSSISGTDSVVGMDYHGLLTLVTLDLIETVVLKFSRLGVHAFFGGGERYYRACILQDETTSMFDTPIAAPGITTTTTSSSPSHSTAPSPGSSPDMGPLANYSNHLIAQLVDLWFTHHPLNILLSRSLLLTDLRVNPAKPALLAIILVDAHRFTKNPDSGEQAEQLLEWAISQLHHLKNDNPDLTAAQACFLLAWYYSCRGQTRRAVCYTVHAGRTVTQLKFKIHETPITDKTHINGIDRGSVENEMIQNLWWLTFSVTLWSFIQMDISFADLLPSRCMQIFPPSKGADCSLLQLDRTMGNIATQQAQTTSLQSIWLLSHVSSFVAHIYALYPYPKREPLSIDRPVNNWQEQLLSRLDHLMNRERRLAEVCVDAREATQDMIDCINKDAGEDSVGPWLLIQYYTVSIHMLFPQSEPLLVMSATPGSGGSTGDSSVSDLDCHPPASILTSIVFNGLEKAMQGIIPLFAHVNAAGSSEESRTTAPPAFLHSYVTGLDAIGRAFKHVLHAQGRASALEQQFCSGWLRRLSSGLVTLHKFFDHDILLRDHRWRSVKRQLKYVCKRLEMMNLEHDLDSSSTMLQSSTLANFPIYATIATPAQCTESLPWSDWQSMDQPAPASMDMPTFNLDVSLASANESLMAYNNIHSNGDNIQNNASMLWLQNTTPMASTWTEVQATGSSLPSQLSNTLSTSEPQFTENGKRPADMISYGGTLIGDLSTDGLDPNTFGREPSGKRFRGSS